MAIDKAITKDLHHVRQADVDDIVERASRVPEAQPLLNAWIAEKKKSKLNAYPDAAPEFKTTRTAESGNQPEQPASGEPETEQSGRKGRRVPAETPNPALHEKILSQYAVGTRSRGAKKENRIPKKELPPGVTELRSISGSRGERRVSISFARRTFESPAARAEAIEALYDAATKHPWEVNDPGGKKKIRCRPLPGAGGTQTLQVKYGTAEESDPVLTVRDADTVIIQPDPANATRPHPLAFPVLDKYLGLREKKGFTPQPDSQ